MGDNMSDKVRGHEERARRLYCGELLTLLEIWLEEHPMVVATDDSLIREWIKQERRSLLKPRDQ